MERPDRSDDELVSHRTYITPLSFISVWIIVCWPTCHLHGDGARVRGRPLLVFLALEFLSPRPFLAAYIGNTGRAASRERLFGRGRDIRQATTRGVALDDHSSLIFITQN